MKRPELRPSLPPFALAAALGLAVALGVSGCAAGQSGSAVPAAAGAPPADSGSGAADTTSAGAPAGPAGSVDVCGLLTAAEIKAVIGSNSGPRGGATECQWENQDDYHSVTVDIGQPGTAADGQLPDPLPGAKTEPGPDGIRFSSGNVAEFLIGDRACQVQVVTSTTDESDRPTAVKLIALIRSRVTP